jgi:hypothetical protein
MRIFSVTACLIGAMAVSSCDQQQWKWPWATGGQGPGGTLSNNSFNGNVKAEFLNPDPPADYYRDMKILEDFVYVDPEGTSWMVPAGTITNGASVPWGFWNIIGGPYDGPYRDAAVIHDHFVETRSRPWEATNKMFYNAIRARGVSDALALTMYAGVRYGGPRWDVAAAPEIQKQGSLGRVFSAVTAAIAGEAAPPPQPEATTVPADPKPLAPAEVPAPPVRSLGRSMATDQEMKNFDELRLWIEREKPSLEEIDKRVEELRAREGKSTVRVP